MNAGEEFFNLLDDLKCELAELREEIARFREFLDKGVVLKDESN